MIFFGSLERSAHIYFPVCPPAFFFLVRSHNKLFKDDQVFLNLFLMFSRLLWFSFKLSILE